MDVATIEIPEAQIISDFFLLLKFEICKFVLENFPETFEKFTLQALSKTSPSLIILIGSTMLPFLNFDLKFPTISFNHILLFV